MTNLINPSNIASEEETLFGQRVKNKFLKAYVRMTPELMQELINKAQAGDQEALDRLCRQFKPAVEATAKSPTCAEVLGKDAVSCAWLVFIQLILKTKKPVTVYFPGYIKKVLCRKLIKEIVKTSKQLQCISLDDEECYDEPSVGSFEEVLTDNTLLLSAIKKLTPDQQEIIYKRFFECKTYYDIAKEMNKNYIATQVNGYRALAKLRAILIKLKAHNH